MWKRIFISSVIFSLVLCIKQQAFAQSTVTLTLPTETTVSNSILVSASISGSASSVQFLLDGNALGAPVVQPPYSISWDTTTVTNGMHTLSARVGTITSAAKQITVDNTPKWYSPFTPVRTFYVAPNGSGNGASQSTPMSAQTAFGTGSPGDQFVFLPGTYSIGTVALNKNGTSTNPIVYRAQPGQKVTLLGAFEVYGSSIWIWGFDITGTNGR